MKICKSQSGEFIAIGDDGAIRTLSRQDFTQIALIELSSQTEFRLSSNTKKPELRLFRNLGGHLQVELGAMHLGTFIQAHGTLPIVEVGKSLYLLENSELHTILGQLKSLKIGLGVISPVEAAIIRASTLHRILVDEVGDIWAADEIIQDSTRATGATTVAHGLVIQPYQYQTEGIDFISTMLNSGFGCLLADEMGLGKTAQIIGVISKLSNVGSDFAGKRYLIVVPATLVRNWVREFTKFAPAIFPHVHFGPERTAIPSLLMNHDVVITTYELIWRDALIFRQIVWATVFFDEAQAIKNPNANRTKAARNLRASTKVAVSGTPFENHLTDIWSLMEVITPGLLGSEEVFQAQFPENVPSAHRLSGIVSPFVLRRRLDSLPNALPKKSEFQVLLEPDSNTVAIQREIVQEAIAESRSKLHTITRLLLAAAHAESLGHLSQASNAKTKRLMEVLDEVYENGEKAIVFTPFRSVIDHLVGAHQNAFPEVPTYVVDGRSPVDQRQTIIDDFSAAKSSVCFLNPTVGGAGLNITAANHVIHFSPLWNPSKRRQATARAYRNGQVLPVIVHNFIYENTIEEYIWQTQENKDALSAGIFEHSESDFDIEQFKVFLSE